MSRGFSLVCFVGREFQAASAELGPLEGSEAMFFATSDELASYLATSPLSGVTVLIKGSRGTRMEKVIPAL